MAVCDLLFGVCFGLGFGLVVCLVLFGLVWCCLVYVLCYLIICYVSDHYYMMLGWVGGMVWFVIVVLVVGDDWVCLV